MNWHQAIQDYSNYLKLERGLSQNSISSYTSDIKKLVNYLDEHSITSSSINIKTLTVQEFIYDAAKNLSARSQSRLISALRGFFDYLVFEDYRKTNPLALIESPTVATTGNEGDVSNAIAAIKSKAAAETIKV